MTETAEQTRAREQARRIKEAVVVKRAIEYVDASRAYEKYTRGPDEREKQLAAAWAASELRLRGAVDDLKQSRRLASAN